jgi:hypothetical protein
LSCVRLFHVWYLGVIYGLPVLSRLDCALPDNQRRGLFLSIE